MEVRDNTESIKLLSTQLEEQNQFARTNIQLMVQWFIFFATANYIVIGYFVLKMLDAPLARPNPFYWVAALYVTVNFIALGLCWHARLWFNSSGHGVEAALGRLRELTHSPKEFVEIPAPYVPYARVAGLMAATVLTMLGVWIVMIAATLRVPAQGKSGQSSSLSTQESSTRQPVSPKKADPQPKSGSSAH